jgi:sterol 24-C-methyltransferase
MATDNTGDIIRYYRKKESRIGYNAFLHGTKHFGYYNESDKDWDWQSALRRMEDKLGQTLALPPGTEVLDAGCGVGDVACRMAANFGLRVRGIDVLDFNLEEAHRRTKRRGLESLVSFSKMDYSKLTFPTGMFDGLYTMETLVHAASSETVLSDFYRAPSTVRICPRARSYDAGVGRESICGG